MRAGSMAAPAGRAGYSAGDGRNGRIPFFEEYGSRM